MPRPELRDGLKGVGISLPAARREEVLPVLAISLDPGSLSLDGVAVADREHVPDPESQGGRLPVAEALRQGLDGVQLGRGLGVATEEVKRHRQECAGVGLPPQLAAGARHRL